MALPPRQGGIEVGPPTLSGLDWAKVGPEGQTLAQQRGDLWRNPELDDPDRDSCPVDSPPGSAWADQFAAKGGGSLGDWRIAAFAEVRHWRRTNASVRAPRESGLLLSMRTRTATEGDGVHIIAKHSSIQLIQGLKRLRPGGI